MCILKKKWKLCRYLKRFENMPIVLSHRNTAKRVDWGIIVDLSSPVCTILYKTFTRSPTTMLVLHIIDQFYCMCSKMQTVLVHKFYYSRMWFTFLMLTFQLLFISKDYETYVIAPRCTRNFVFLIHPNQDFIHCEQCRYMFFSPEVWPWFFVARLWHINQWS